MIDDQEFEEMQFLSNTKSRRRVTATTQKEEVWTLYRLPQNHPRNTHPRVWKRAVLDAKLAFEGQLEALQIERLRLLFSDNGPGG